MERICKQDDCGRPLDYSGKGRPPTYCPEHARAARAATWRARPNGGHKERVSPSQCCLDARAAGVERYGVEHNAKVMQRNTDRYATSEFRAELVTVHGAHLRPAKVTKCEQHKEMAPRPSAKLRNVSDQEMDIYDIGGFRFCSRESFAYNVPEAPLSILPESGTKHGVDRVLEREANRWLAKADVKNEELERIAA